MSFNTPIQFVKVINNSYFFIKRDDLLTSHSFGTKFRKFLGFYSYLNLEKFSSILLSGNLHSNYLASFSYFLAMYDIPFVTFAYSKNLNLKSYNSKIIKRFSKLYQFSSFKQMENSIKASIKDDNQNLEIPKYGIHFSSFKGLESLSHEILKYEQNFDKIFVDIGSGLTYLSLYQFFGNKVVGICIGARRESLKKELEDNAKKLNINLQNPNLITCKICPKFAKINQTLLNYIKNYYNDYNIALEPIYSAKTVYTIEDILLKEYKKQNILYVHQGGLSNFFDID